jgi:hypothetical protein
MGRTCLSVAKKTTKQHPVQKFLPELWPCLPRSGLDILRLVIQALLLQNEEKTPLREAPTPPLFDSGATIDKFCCFLYNHGERRGGQKKVQTARAYEAGRDNQNHLSTPWGNRWIA